jgi:hypothetical protein
VSRTEKASGWGDHLNWRRHPAGGEATRALIRPLASTEQLLTIWSVAGCCGRVAAVAQRLDQFGYVSVELAGSEHAKVP